MDIKEIYDGIKLKELNAVYDYIKYHMNDDDYSKANDKISGTYIIYKRRNKYSKWKEVGKCTEDDFNIMLEQAKFEKMLDAHTERPLIPTTERYKNDIDEIIRQLKEDV